MNRINLRVLCVRFLKETLALAQDINRRVVVPIMVRMALGANPVADVGVLDSRKLLVAETALGANLMRTFTKKNGYCKF